MFSPALWWKPICQAYNTTIRKGFSSIIEINIKMSTCHFESLSVICRIAGRVLSVVPVRITIHGQRVWCVGMCALKVDSIQLDQ